MPDAAKKKAIRDITTALEAGALHHNIAKRFSLSDVATAHEVQDTGKMMGNAISVNNPPPPWWGWQFSCNATSL